MGAQGQLKNEFGFTPGQSADNSAVGDSPEVLTRIYEQQINIAVLKRTLNHEVTHYCQELVRSRPSFNLRIVINAENPSRALKESLPELTGTSAFTEDLALLMEMYACLFDLDEIGIRLQVLDRAMCPRFHTDRLGCRLVSTYLGPGTEWLQNHLLDRTKLGPGSMGSSDEESGLIADDGCIQQVSTGDIVLLKGEGWYDNEGLGAVHRSPAVMHNEKRIVVTMDFA